MATTKNKKTVEAEKPATTEQAEKPKTETKKEAKILDRVFCNGCKKLQVERKAGKAEAKCKDGTELLRVQRGGLFYFLAKEKKCNM